MFSTPGHLQWPRGAVRTATTSDCFCPRCTTMDRSKQNQTSFRQKKHASAVCLRQTKTCAPDLANCRSVKLWLSSTAAFVYGKAHRITEKKKLHHSETGTIQKTFLTIPTQLWRKEVSPHLPRCTSQWNRSYNEIHSPSECRMPWTLP